MIIYHELLYLWSERAVLQCAYEFSIPWRSHFFGLFHGALGNSAIIRNTVSTAPSLSRVYPDASRGVMSAENCVDFLFSERLRSNSARVTCFPSLFTCYPRTYESFSTLDYPGFRYLRSHTPKKHPNEFLLTALGQKSLDARVAEALPWVAANSAELNSWLLRMHGNSISRIVLDLSSPWRGTRLTG